MWRSIIVGPGKSWVLFRQGTCVIITVPTADIRSEATNLLREWGPVHEGTPAGDFGVTHLDDDPGWVVTCHHPDILTYVSPKNVARAAKDIEIGLLGRARRNQDSAELEIAHIESASV